MIREFPGTLWDNSSPLLGRLIELKIIFTGTTSSMRSLGSFYSAICMCRCYAGAKAGLIVLKTYQVWKG